MSHSVEDAILPDPTVDRGTRFTLPPGPRAHPLVQLLSYVPQPMRFFDAAHKVVGN